MIENLIDLIYKMIERGAQAFRGPDYRIDRSVPLMSVIGVVFWRGTALCRCIIRGLVISWDPRKLVFVAPGVEVRNRSLTRFGAGVTLGKGVIIDGLSKKGVSLGNGVTIGPYSIIEATGIITDIGEGCSIGDNSGLGAFSFIGAAGGVWIGKDVIMGQRVSFHSENHRYESTNNPIRVQGVTRKGISIEDDCWIGSGVTFLDGAYVENGCVIGAGSLVRDRIPSNSIAVGIPAKVIGRRGEEN